MSHVLTPDRAVELIHMTLGHVLREYPHSENVRLNSAADLATPRCAHPVFFGSYDWHSCVHSYWLLARLLDRFPNSDAAGEVVALFDEQLTVEKVERELAWLSAPGRGGFERPYGWAWLLRLQGALHVLRHPHAAAWKRNLQPLADLLSDSFIGYLSRLGFPVRAGTHTNTAFAMLFAYDYAERTGNTRLIEAVTGRGQAYYLADAGYHGWEPGEKISFRPAGRKPCSCSGYLGVETFWSGLVVFCRSWQRGGQRACSFLWSRWIVRTDVSRILMGSTSVARGACVSWRWGWMSSMADEMCCRLQHYVICK